MQIAKGIWHFITSIKQMQKDRGMFLNKHYEIPFVKEYAAVLIYEVIKNAICPSENLLRRSWRFA